MDEKRMKIAYGTYGMPEMPLLPALPRLKEIGYEGVELAVAARYTAAPARLPAAERRAVRQCLRDLDLELPALLLLSRILTTNPEEYRADLAEFHAAAEMAADLAPAGTLPVLTATVGGGGLSWESDRAEIFARVAEWAAVASAQGTRFALEPHIGGVLERPERVLELLAAVKAPGLGLNFDISHFAVAGYPLEETVAQLAPHAIHTHVKDGRMVDGKVQFLLPGEGDFDYPAYFRAMRAAGWRGCVTVEVSGMVFNRPGYDAFAAAEFAFGALAGAGGLEQWSSGVME